MEEIQGSVLAEDKGGVYGVETAQNATERRKIKSIIQFYKVTLARAFLCLLPACEMWLLLLSQSISTVPKARIKAQILRTPTVEWWSQTSSTSFT